MSDNMVEQIKPKDWDARRHSYGPQHIGLTTPPDELDDRKDGYSPRIAFPEDEVKTPSEMTIETNALLRDLITVYQHSVVDETDIDVSDSSLYTLASGQGATMRYVVPDNYVMLLREFNTSLVDSSTYYTYINGKLFQSCPDMSFPGLGLALAPEVAFDIYVINNAAFSQRYMSLISATIRRSANWEYPTYSYKRPIE
jgi:hypothetical protein